MGFQNGVQLLRRGMEGEADVPDFSFRFLLLHEAPHVEVVEEMGSALAEVVEQIKVKITGAGLFQRCLELADGVFPALAVYPCGVFRGERELFARIAFDERLTDRVFRAGISPGRVEIRKAGRHEEVDHLFYLFDVDRFAVFRQPHQPKSKFFRAQFDFRHVAPSLSILFFLILNSPANPNGPPGLPLAVNRT